jgi:hypothetical protein
MMSATEGETSFCSHPNPDLPTNAPIAIENLKSEDVRMPGCRPAVRGHLK